MAYNFTVRTIEKIGWQFYLVNPRDHMYEKVEDFPTPSYTNQVIKFVWIRNIIVPTKLVTLLCQNGWKNPSILTIDGATSKNPNSFDKEPNLFYILSNKD